MIYLLYGDETFLIRERVRALKATFEPSLAALNIETLDPKTSAEGFSAAVTTMPFLGTRRLVIAEEWLSRQAKKLEGLDFEALMEQIPESTDVIFVEASIDKRQRLYKYLLKQADPLEAKLLDVPGAQQWLMRRAGGVHAEISGEAAMLLVNRVGTSLWTLDQELRKLIAYTNGREISRREVELLAPRQYQEDVFGMTDALAGRNTAVALQVLHKNLESGAHPLLLLKLIVNHYRRLLYARGLLDSRQGGADQLAADLKVHPFAAKKITQQARQYPMVNLRHDFGLLAQIDRDIKIGKLDAGMALDWFAIRSASVAAH